MDISSPRSWILRWEHDEKVRISILLPGAPPRYYHCVIRRINLQSFAYHYLRDPESSHRKDFGWKEPPQATIDDALKDL